MFDDLVESSVVRKKTNKSWTVLVSAILQVGVISIFILIPLIFTDVLPAGQLLSTMLVAPPPPAAPPPPPPAAPQVVHHIVRIIQAGKMMAPSVIPKQVKMIKEEELPPDVGAVGVVGGVPGGVPGGQVGGVLGGIIGGTGSTLPPPPKMQRIRVGGNVQSAKLVRQVMPVYPPIAKTAHIQGDVVLHAIIDKDGSVTELQFISGPPILIRAAMDAVRQWRYAPTLLNNEPVQVDTTITVKFTLGG